MHHMRKAAEDIMLSSLGTPYIWGGNSLEQDRGGDCSGTIVDLYRRLELIPWTQDYTAQAFYDLNKTRPDERLFGCHYYYGTSLTNITHIVFGYDNTGIIIGANGGGSATDTIAEARRDGAQLQFDEFDYRKDLKAVRMPKYPWIRVTTDELNLRDAPKIESTVITAIPKGRVVELKVRDRLFTETGGVKWAPVYYDGKEGWVSNNYLTA